MTDERKHMDIKQFRELGFLQEVNRQFFHPLGLALEVAIEDDGSMHLGGVWDYRDDPEGIIFANLNDTDKERAAAIKRLWDEKAKVRMKRFGWIVEPI